MILLSASAVLTGDEVENWSDWDTEVNRSVSHVIISCDVIDDVTVSIHQ